MSTTTKRKHKKRKQTVKLLIKLITAVTALLTGVASLIAAIGLLINR